MFALQQALSSWEHYQTQIEACDQKIAALLPSDDDDEGKRDEVVLRGPRKGASENAPKIPHLRQQVARLCGGKDLAVLPAHTEYGVLRLIGEVGTDPSMTMWGDGSWMPKGDPGFCHHGLLRLRLAMTEHAVYGYCACL